MLPSLQKEVTERRGWATEEELLDYYALAQCIPGIIAVNTACFIGHKLKGVVGEIAAALGVITPSYIIISIIATSIQQFANIKAVQNALAGIRIAICVLIISAVIRMGKTSLKGWPCFAVFLGVLAVLIAFSPSPAFIIMASVILRLIFPRKENDI